jgi:purine-binding chemotaxis protein CheW
LVDREVIYMAVKEEKSTGEVVQVVNFCLGNEEFGADVALVREITRVANISHIPEAPSFIKGVTNLRGQIVAVIDLAGQFGFGQRDKLPESARIIVTEVQEQTVGMLVDKVPGVLKIPEENIKPTPELIQAKLGKDYVKGVGKLEDRLIILLDLEKVLALHEVEEVAKVGISETKE